MSDERNGRLDKASKERAVRENKQIEIDEYNSSNYYKGIENKNNNSNNDVNKNLEDDIFGLFNNNNFNNSKNNKNQNINNINNMNNNFYNNNININNQNNKNYNNMINNFYNNNNNQQINNNSSFFINQNKITQLENENNNLKITIQNLSNENQKLKNEIKSNENEINKYKKLEIDLNNKIRNYQENIQNLINEKNELFNKMNNGNDKDKDKQIMTLMNELINKDKEIKNLNSNMEYSLKPGEKLMTVIVESVDKQFQYAVICKNSDKLYKIEEMLYEQFPEYLEEKFYFMLGGNVLNQFKTIEQNNIKFSDKILMKKYDFDN